MNRILVIGVPRSGTSWVGRVLGATARATYLGEPDNHEHAPFALRAKLGQPGYFYPRPTGEAVEYDRLWRHALAIEEGAARGLGPLVRARRKLSGKLLGSASDADLLAALEDPGHAPLGLRLATMLAVPERPVRITADLVVKSVHAELALDWITERFPVKVLVVFRHPLNVLSSWKELGWLDPAASDPLAELEPTVARALAEELHVEPEADGTRLERATWLVGLLTSVLASGSEQHANWEQVSHEELCEAPHRVFADVARLLGLEWSCEVDALLDELDRPGTGYETTREAHGLRDVWRERLTKDEVHEATAVLEQFPRGSEWLGSAP